METSTQSVFLSLCKNYLSDIAQFLDSLLIYGESLVVIMTIYIALRIAIIEYTKPLKVILSPIGMGRIHRLWLSIMIRRKNINSLRIFIELACIESQGEPQSRKWWRERIKQHFNNNEMHPIFINNCFDLRKPGLNSIIKEYFDYFRDSHNTPNTPLEFISQIYIKEGYLAPMSFITGLQSRFGEDWSRIINNYTSTIMTNNDSTIIPSELYFSYGWLMWGPSYQCETRSKHMKEELILYGYGDEANSINIIVNQVNEGDALWEKLSPSVAFNTNFGFYCSVVGHLVSTSDYSPAYRNTLDEASIPFFSRMAHSKETSFALKLTSYKDMDTDNSNRCFFSAYLWIMFSLDQENFTLHKSLTFFEHANLPDVDNYKFLTNRLIDKVFNHFREIYHTPEFANRKYYYCLSFNSYVQQKFEERIESIKREDEDAKFSQWVMQNIDYSDISIDQVLDSIDNYFKANNFSLLSNKSEDLLALSKFYVKNYQNSNSSIWTFDNLMSIVTSNDNRFEEHFMYGHWHNDESLIGYSVCHIDNANMCAIVDHLSLQLTHDLEIHHHSFVLSIIGSLEHLLRSKSNNSSDNCIILVNKSPYLNGCQGNLYDVRGYQQWCTNLTISEQTYLEGRIIKAINHYEATAK